MDCYLFSQTSSGDVVSSHFGMVRVKLQRGDFETRVFGSKPDATVAAQSADLKTVFGVDSFGLEGEKLCKGTRGVNWR